MAKIYSVNNSPATGAEAVFILKTTQVSAGFTVPSSSNGTTYNASGDQIASASDLAAANAWFRVRDPSGRREWLFQRGANNTQWRVKFSEAAGFVGGSPSATVTPSATDEVVLFGGGTDAAPTFATLLNADNAYRCHAVVLDVAATPTNVYPFFFFCSDKTTGVVRTLITMDALHSTHSADVSPALLICYYQTSTLTFSQFVNFTLNSNILKGWHKYGLSGAAFLTYRGTGIGSGGATMLPPESANYNTSPNDVDGEHNVARLVGGFRTSNDTQRAFKGIGHHWAWPMELARTYPDTLNLATEAYVYISPAFAMPWPETIAPLI